MKRILPPTTVYIREHIPLGKRYAFSQAAGISRSNIYLYYDGQSVPPIAVMQKLVNFIGVPFTLTLTPEGKK